MKYTNQVRLEDVTDAAAEDGVAVVAEVKVPVGRLPRGRAAQRPKFGQDSSAGKYTLALRL